MTPKAVQTVHLGFEIPSGKPVTLPIRHMVVTGQTQEAGKTTTLEALIARAGVKAVAFITKRGEGSFTSARTIQPYFAEQLTDAGFIEWRYVASILEASLGEKLKFERSWIMRASKGARTLEAVQRNVQAALADPKTKGLSADVYFALNEYLQTVVPQIARVQWAHRVDLAPGISVMDLGALGIEMQHLVIRSTIDWILHHAEDAVVVVPEAWKFIPQGRGSPVKLAAEAFIRQAAALRNYLWLDSQDIAGVEKLILKSVPVWLLGVQREANEVKRTLEQMPIAVPKLKPAEVVSLGLGQFFACYGTTVVKTYVQPIWMDEAEAAGIARGDVAHIPARPPQPALDEATYHRLAGHGPIPTGEDEVDQQEAQRLRDDNARLTQENAELGRRLAELERLVAPITGRPDVTPSAPRSPDPAEDPTGPTSAPLNSPLQEALYQAIKQRLTADAPALLKVLVLKPELEIEVTRETVTATGKTWLGRVAQLMAEGFFDTPRKATVVFTEAARRGMGGVPPRAYEACDKLHSMGFLLKDDEGYTAVKGMKVNIVNGR